MRLFFLLLLLISLEGRSQWKSFTIGVKGDTLNCIDKNNLKQGKWLNHYDEVRGEPGFEEEGRYVDSRKEGVWRLYSLQGDVAGLENYRWGNKDGVSQYFNTAGALVREEGWKAMNPAKQYDTLEVEDIDHLDHYKRVVVKNEGVAIKHGVWKYFDPASGMIYKTETYSVGKLEPSKDLAKNSMVNDSSKTKVKPKEVMDFEKKNSGKKKVKVHDGSIY